MMLNYCFTVALKTHLKFSHVGSIWLAHDGGLLMGGWYSPKAIRDEADF
jgi:hypothetical protein